MLVLVNHSTVWYITIMLMTSLGSELLFRWSALMSLTKFLGIRSISFPVHQLRKSFIIKTSNKNEVHICGFIFYALVKAPSILVGAFLGAKTEWWGCQMIFRVCLFRACVCRKSALLWKWFIENEGDSFSIQCVVGNESISLKRYRDCWSGRHVVEASDS